MVSPTSRTRFGAAQAAPVLVLLAILAIGYPFALRAQWRVEAWFGDAVQLPTKVTFSQNGQAPISTVGHWSTRPFNPTWYYATRIGKWSDSSSWAFEYMHHKMYLDNPPPGVAYFQITNGENFFFGERLWSRHHWEFGVGAGPVLTVPVSRVRGEIYDNAHGIFRSKYEWGGAGLTANVARRVRLLPYVYGDLSLKLTASYLAPRISDGHASLFNFALHAQYGVSFQSRSR